MTDYQQQARAILDRLTQAPFDSCIPIARDFSLAPRPGVYAIRHRLDGLLYLGKTNDLSVRFSGGHKAFTWAWLDLYHPSDIRIAVEPIAALGKSEVIIRVRVNPFKGN